MRQNKNTWF